MCVERLESESLKDNKNSPRKRGTALTSYRPKLFVKVKEIV